MFNIIFKNKCAVYKGGGTEKGQEKLTFLRTKKKLSKEYKTDFLYKTFFSYNLNTKGCGI